jgi:hypothetical protein
MPAAIVLRGTPRGIRSIDREAVIIDMIAVHVVQVPVMKVIGVVAVSYRRMPAPRFVLVAVSFVYLTVALPRHRPASSPVDRKSSFTVQAAGISRWPVRCPCVVYRTAAVVATAPVAASSLTSR